MHHHAHRSLIHSPTACTKEESRTAWKQLSAHVEVRIQCTRRRSAIRHDPLLISLAEDANRATISIHIIKIQSGELRNADSRGVQHLDHRAVANVHRIVVIRRDRRDVHELYGGFGIKHGRKFALPLR